MNSDQIVAILKGRGCEQIHIQSLASTGDFHASLIVQNNTQYGSTRYESSTHKTMVGALTELHHQIFSDGVRR